MGIALNRSNTKENAQIGHEHTTGCWNHQSLANAKPSQNESAHIHWGGFHRANRKRPRLVRRYRKWNVCAGRVVTQNASGTRENSVEARKHKTELCSDQQSHPPIHMRNNSRPDVRFHMWGISIVNPREMEQCFPQMRARGRDSCFNRHSVMTVVTWKTLGKHRSTRWVESPLLHCIHGSA